MIEKISALQVVTEKTALLERLFHPESTARAVVGGNLFDAAKAGLKSHGLRRNAAAITEHTGQAIHGVPTAGQAFMGDLYTQEAAKQRARLVKGQANLMNAGHAVPHLQHPDWNGPNIAPTAAPSSTAQAHQRLVVKNAPNAQKSQGALGIDLSNYHPSMLLGGAGAVGGIAASDNMEEAPQNIAAGAGMGLIGGIGLRHLKHASLNPSMNIGPIGMGVRPDTERLPGTYRSVPTSVIQRVGEGMDGGMSAEQAIAHGAKAPEVNATPAIATVAGALAGHYISPGVKGLLLGGGLGYAGGTLMKGQLQKDYQQDARTALQGLSIERSRMGIR